MIRAISIGVAVIFLLQIFYYKQTQAKGPLCLLMDDDRPLGPMPQLLRSRANKLASKISVALATFSCDFLIVIIGA
ncbi:hypothetical protein P7H19_10805 [Paenibacillus larvae]|nr:hypothetical protein [Paenibacillus larvae]MDT2236689.1 hypothetical protein [Paenibacillus larvae]